LRELSLHILDLIENAVAAGASRVAVEVTQETEWDLMRIVVEDNGPGLSVPAEQAMDPFYTTKKGKKLGLGLSLFRFRIEQAGGELLLDRSALGGLAVRATLSLAHVDRNPLGDLASTLSSVLAANPELDLSLRIRSGDRQQVIESSEAAREPAARDCSAFDKDEISGPSAPPPSAGSHPLSVARQMYRKIKAGLAALQIKE
jgi:hypothetical protein